MPDPSTFDGLLNLFTVCNLIELSNIAHPKTYTPHGLGPEERYDLVHARKQSRQIVTWVLGSFEFEGEVSIEDFYWRYLAYQARAICRGKEFSEANKAFSFDHGQFAEKVRSLVKHSFKNVQEFWPMWELYNQSEPRSFAWPTDSIYHIKPRLLKKDGTSSLFHCCPPLLTNFQSNLVGKRMGRTTMIYFPWTCLTPGTITLVS